MSEHTNSNANIPEWEANDLQANQELVQDFIQNATELIDTLNSNVLILEKENENQDVVETIFATAHTLKGVAGMFGFTGIQHLVHRTENLFAEIRSGKLAVTTEVIDAVLKSSSALTALVGAVKAGEPCGLPIAPLLDALDQLAVGGPAHNNIAASPSHSKTQGQDPTFAVEDSSIRLDIKRIDALVDLASQLATEQAQINALNQELHPHITDRKLASRLAESVQILGRQVNEVHSKLMKARMVPINQVFVRLPLYVRDLAKNLGKEIKLVVTGETTELDKSLIEQLANPLIHLIRNACDHGIEHPEERLTVGKSEAGTITLSAKQEHDHVSITIQDDGRGMDSKKILAKAVSDGHVAGGQDLSTAEILKLLFIPGFTTAESVTEISGRGVGLDAVRKQVAKLKGRIHLESDLGWGSTIKITIPTSLSVRQALLTRVRHEIFAIPLNTIVQSMRIKPEQVIANNSQESIVVRGEQIPLIHLSEILRLDAANTSIASNLRVLREAIDSDGHRRSNQPAKFKHMFVVIVNSHSENFGIVVDELLSQHTMFVKTLGPLFQQTPFISGATILSQGDVALVLDIAEIDEHCYEQRRRNKAA